jgi:hypothetical protein
MIRPDVARRIGPDLEILAEADGIALRPGPRQTIAPDTVGELPVFSSYTNLRVAR